jgi:microsomal epoxide hydrolase
MSIKPFTIKTDRARLDWIKTRIEGAVYPPQIKLGAGEDIWAYGTDVDYMRELCAYWLGEYDWQETLDELNRFTHFTAAVAGYDIHFIREDGSGDAPEPLLMTHGWPGSVYEFIDVIDRLAHPENYGGDAQDGVTVICPSLPGYGFSSAPARPIGQVTTAALWDKLMREALGFDTYIAQGGDWGSVVTGLLGLNHGINKGGGCKAIHMNMYGLQSAQPPSTPEEQAWAEGFAAKMQAEGAYLQLQATKPQSLALAMADSPLGIAAWIVEKFHGWSDIFADSGRDIAKRYTKHRLLSNIMIYLMTDSFATSVWFYRGYIEEMPHIAEGDKIEVPCGIGNFAEPYITFPPRSLMEGSYNIVHWNDYDTVGHFAAMEDAEMFTADVQQFLKTL